MGAAGDKETETEVLLLEHDVPHQPFSQEVLSFLPQMPWSITDEVEAQHPPANPPTFVSPIQFYSIAGHTSLPRNEVCKNEEMCFTSCLGPKVFTHLAMG